MIDGVRFSLAIFLAFFIPGDLIVFRWKLPFLVRLTASLATGLVFWGLLGLVFGRLNLRGLSYVYLLIVFILYLFFQFRKRKKALLALNVRPDFLLSLIFGLGLLVQFFSIGFMGLSGLKGIYYCCGAPDTLYHLALTNEVIKKIPPDEPGMSGEIVRNYHYLSNVVIGEIVRVFHLPLTAVQYQYFPLLISALLGLSALAFAGLNHWNSVQKRLLIFFLFFSGDLIFIIHWLLNRGFNFNLSLLENATTLWASPPRVFGMVLIFGTLNLLLIWSKRKDNITGILLGLTAGSVVGFKVYEGIFVLTGLTAVMLWRSLKGDKQAFLPLFMAFSTAAIIFLPVNRGAGGLFFSGFWRFEDFIVQPSLGLSRLELGRRIYLDHHNWFKVIWYEFIFGLLYFISLFGIFLFGFCQTRKSLRCLSSNGHIFLLSGLLVNLFFGLFFLQKIGGANTSQFLLVVYYTGSVYTAMALGYWFVKIKTPALKVVFLIILVSLTSVKVIKNTGENINRLITYNMFLTDKTRLEAIDYLKQFSKEGQIVLVDDEADGMNNYYYWINFVLNRPLYLTGGGILKDHGVDIGNRQKIMKIILYNPDADKVKNRLKESGIRYVVMPAKHHLASGSENDLFMTIYQNSDLKIIAVNHDLL